MIIDFHNHVRPPKYADNPRWQGKCPMALDRVLAAQDRTGVDFIVISNAIHGVGQREPTERLEVIREYNQFFAETQDKYSDRLAAFACALPSGGDAVLKELERAGLDGVAGRRSVVGDAIQIRHAQIVRWLLGDQHERTRHQADPGHGFARRGQGQDILR